MKGWRAAAFGAALAIVGVLVVGVAPEGHGQTKIVRAQGAKAVVDILSGSRIGVSIRDLQDADLKAVKGVTAGVMVEEVSTDSPAEKAGIRKGDVIVEFDGERVRSARQLTRLVQETPASRSVPTTVVREGQRSSLTVTPTDGKAFSRFGDWPLPPKPPTPPPPPAVFRFDGLIGRTGALGVTIDALSPQLADYFGTKQGVLVTSVSDNSAGAKAGIKAGDVITSLNGSPVDDPADVRRHIQSARDGDEFTLEVMRERKPLTLKGKIERPEPIRRSYQTII
jgi:serine protease Do